MSFFSLPQFKLNKKSEKIFANGVVKEITYTLKINSTAVFNKKFINVQDEMKNLFQKMIDAVKQNYKPDDFIQISMTSPELSHSINITPVQLAHFDIDQIFQHIELVLNSNEDVNVDDHLQITIGILSNIMQIEGQKYNQDIDLGEQLSKNKSILQIRNNDISCGYKAIVVGFSKLMKRKETRDVMDPTLSSYDNLFYNKVCTVSFYKHLTQRDYVQQKLVNYMKDEWIPNHNFRLPLKIADIPKFENLLKVNINVVQQEFGGIQVTYTSKKYTENMYLFLHDNHFDLIVTLTGFFKSAYFCEQCMKPYNNRQYHQCPKHCTICLSDCSAGGTESVDCVDCHANCKNQTCLNNHKINQFKGQTICQYYYFCPECRKKLKRSISDHHNCNEIFCKNCRQHVQDDHLCFQKNYDVPTKYNDKFVFYDFEAIQGEFAKECDLGYKATHVDGCTKEECSTEHLCHVCFLCLHCQESSCGRAIHTPNLVIAHTMCNKCNTEDTHCTYCGQLCNLPNHKPCRKCSFSKEYIFKGIGCEEKLYSTFLKERYGGFNFIAHNMKGYDGYFLLDYLCQKKIKPTNVIFTGSKLLYLELKKLHIQFLDSFNYLPMKLASLPKAFGLTELKKGFFPHKFNTTEHFNYVGPIPDKEYFDPDQMMVDNRIAFLQWYEEQHYIYDFQKELVEYCRSDVDILMRACIKFRNLMIESTKIDPFEYISAASVTMAVFKTNFLENIVEVKLPNNKTVEAIKKAGVYRNSVTGEIISDIKQTIFRKSKIACVPTTGYVSNTTYSKASIEYLEWIMHTTDKRIRHALNGKGEVKIGTYYVDGLCEETKEVYEYHGCIFHGCPQCYPDNRHAPVLRGKSMHVLYVRTCNKRQYLINAGYTVIEKWEHDFIEDKNQNVDLKVFIKTLVIKKRLNPRDSFFGGRTNAIQLYKKIDLSLGESIKYVDFTSLYPYVNKYKKYPVGHPTVITENFRDIKDYFGIAKVIILPPKRLYFPILPTKGEDQKLKFVLCKICANEESKKCQHTDEERCLEGTWCTPEINKAVEKGYKIIKIEEVYHFPNTEEYDPQTKSGGLFAEFINTFLKIKQESSGWPSYCQTKEDKDRYIQEYFEKEGIRLDKNNIKKNPGLRSLAKLLLNSFWGKFGQRSLYSTVQFYTDDDLANLFGLINNRLVTLQNYFVINNNFLMVNYTNHKNQMEGLNCLSNVFLASFTTSYARLKLIEEMELIDNRVLYHDTDSIIYIHKSQLYNPTLGSYLGELTDELDDPEDYIVEFVAGGPKNYAYLTHKGHTVCKVRGFRFNYHNQQLVNFYKMKEIVHQDLNTKIITQHFKINRDMKQFKLYSLLQNKTYRVCYTKRYLDEHVSYPYGY